MQTVDLQGAHLSLQQAHLWKFQAINKTLRAQCMVKIEGRLFIETFQQALQRAVERHEILRTTFSIPAGMDVPMQVIKPREHLVCPLVELDAMDTASQLSFLDELFVEMQTFAFDLEHGPLLRASLVRLAAHSHVLLLCLPALCADATTLKHLCAEVQQDYTDQVRVEATLITEEPLQYADVSAWQNDLLTSQDAQMHRDFWSKYALAQLSSVHIPFEQSKDGMDPAEPSFDTDGWMAQRLSLVVEEEISTQLLALAQQHRVAPEAVLLASWQILLWRLTDASPCLVGLACDGRYYEELASALGLYTRMLPLGTAFSADQSFAYVLETVNVSLSEATQEQYYFTWKALQGSTSQKVPAPFFPLGFEWLVWPALSCGGLTTSLQQLSCISDPFILKLQALQIDQRLRLDMLFHPGRLAATQVQRIADALLTLLKHALAEPQTPIGSLPLISLEHLPRDLVTGVQRPFATPPLHKLFEAQAALYPQTLAVVCEQEQLTYAQLDQQANQLARHLQHLGVGPDVLVGLYLERSVQQIVALLAVLKAGGAYVPLDPQLPAYRLAVQLADVNVLLVVTQSTLQERLYEGDWRDQGRILCMDQDAALIAQYSMLPLAQTVEPQHLAYVIYTSGSTGVPKGVMIRQSNVSNYTQSLCEILQVQPGWHWATVSTLAADLGNTVIFGALASAGTLHVLPYETVVSGSAFLHAARRWSFDVLKIVPSHLSALLASVEEADAALLLPRRRLILGGELFRVKLLQQLRAMGAACCIINHYGPTEATVGALIHVVDSLQEETNVQNVAAWQPSVHATGVPIGRPIANTEAYILDRQRQLVPPGITGELYLGGAGLAAGYLHRPEQTEERFVPHPFQPAARLYRTGDLVRVSVDGLIEFIGRSDTQVKIRGYRVELTDIEAALNQHVQIRESIVLLRDQQVGEPRLVAYIIGNQSEEIEIDTVRTFIEERVPSYMVPSAFVCLRRLPLTANGKIDHRQLPEPEELATEVQGKDDGPRTPVEELLVGIWEEVLKVRRVGVHDNFANLGGHSLLATQIISRVRSVLNVEVPLRSLFEVPTVAGLASQVEQVQRREQGVATLPLVPIERNRPLPLSFAQQRLWFLDQLEPANPAYSVPRAVRLSGKLDVVVLERSLREIVRRHESLRTTFQIVADELVQVIGTAEDFALPVTYLDDLPLTLSEEQLQLILLQEAQVAFDLARGPLLRVLLLRLDAKEHVLLLTMHHIVSDAWSSGIFVRELNTLYGAYIKGEEPALPVWTLQYADFAVWQRQWLQGAVLQCQVDYWSEQLRELVPLELPTDHPRPAVQNFRGGHQEVTLAPWLRDALQALSRQEGVTLFMTLLTAFQVLLARYSGQSDITVGTPIANRTRSELEGVIGFFVNTLVMRSDLSGNPTFKELLGRVREMALAAYTHQDVPFEKLVEVLQPVRDLSRPPFFQVMFELQNAPHPSLELMGLTLTALDRIPTTAKFDLTMLVAETAQGLRCQIGYNSDLFEASTISRFLEHWQILLIGIVADAKQQISELEVLSEIERHVLLDTWTHTAPDSSRQLCLHEVFAEQVRQTPDAIAMGCEEQQLTYAELNRRANQLAHWLIKHGAGPEVVVGICFERSFTLIVSVLATLKAGAAYLPLDPALPQTRVAHMLQEAQPQLLLTNNALVKQLPTTSAEVLYVDQEHDPAAGEATDDPVVTLSPENLAYIVYTSGSTGQPKGIQIAHRGVVNYLNYLAQFPHINTAAVVLQLASFTFDAWVREVFGTFSTGARLMLLKPHEIKDPQAILTQIEHQQVTCILSIVPSFLRALQQTIEEGQAGCPTLQLILTSGENLFIADCQRVWATLGKTIHIINQYGPTECTMTTTYYAVDAARQASGIALVGRPIPKMQTYVLDHYMHPAPVSIPGEIYLSGPGLARGYLKQSAVTAERFISHPFSKQPGERLYRTGDRGRYLADGTLELLGRNDQQVKIRGNRVELGEIEAVLAQYPDIQACTVLAMEYTPGDRYLLAYIVCKPAGNVSSRDIQRYLQAYLPEYMLPAFYITLPALPLTPNGKVDRQKLIQLQAGADKQMHFLAGQDAMKKFVQPRDEVEHQLQHIWEEVLNVQPISVLDSFFDLGGHSILAVALVSRISKQFAQKLTLATFFSYPTIAALAPVLRQQTLSDEHTHGLVALQTGGSSLPFFCVPPAGGYPFCYVSLARHLGAEQPFYALDIAEFVGVEDHVSIETLAASCVAAIQLVQPQGPYLLGGWSFGGIVAFEMAQQLQRQGQEILLLALIDSHVPASYFYTPASGEQADTSTLSLVKAAMKLIHMPDPGEDFYQLSSEEQFAAIYKQVQIVNFIPADVEMQEFHRFMIIRCIHMHAGRIYMPQIYPASITLFRATEDAEITDEQARSKEGLIRLTHTRGWDRLTTKDVHVSIIPGDHRQLVEEPYVKALAASLSNCIDKVRSSAHTNC